MYPEEQRELGCPIFSNYLYYGTEEGRELPMLQLTYPVVPTPHSEEATETHHGVCIKMPWQIML